MTALGVVPQSQRSGESGVTGRFESPQQEFDPSAARVAAEVLGRSFPPDDFPTPLVEIKNFEQSDADGIWKLYTIHVFILKLSEGFRLAPGVIAEWLTPKEFMTREPATHTARYVLRQIEEKELTLTWRR